MVNTLRAHMHKPAARWVHLDTTRESHQLPAVSASPCSQFLVRAFYHARTGRASVFNSVFVAWLEKCQQQDCPSVCSDETAAGEGGEGTPQCQWRVLPAKPLSASLDMRQEVMETLLSYLEVRSRLSATHVLCQTLPHVADSEAAFFHNPLTRLGTCRLAH